MDPSSSGDSAIVGEDGVCSSAVFARRRLGNLRGENCKSRLLSEFVDLVWSLAGDVGVEFDTGGDKGRCGIVDGWTGGGERDLNGALGTDDDKGCGLTDVGEDGKLLSLAKNFRAPDFFEP